MKPPPEQEPFIRKCRRISEQIQEESLSVDGEFMTELDMKAANFSEYLDYCLTTCQVCINKGLKH